MTETDAQAWQKALERQMRTLRQRGVDMASIAREPMPADILDTDYLEGRSINGGWLDLQDILRGLLYQGAAAATPLPRLEGIEHKALALLRHNPDECLFMLFQALPDLGLGYCATHALLCGAVGVLTADKLTLPPDNGAMLLRSALVMNIGMARPQDSLARQHKPPSPEQRSIITGHPPTSADILRGFGVQDPEWLDIVHWHHTPEATTGHAEQQLNLQLLNLADTLVAKMAPRISRPAMSALDAEKSLVLEATAQTQNQRVAMASVLGFYPPGTYVQLANGEVAVVAMRGLKANHPHVASIISKDGIPFSVYIYRDTSLPEVAVLNPLSPNKIKIQVSLDKVRKALRQK